MEQTTCCQEDIESIMQRLKGQKTPYTPAKVRLAPPPSASSPEVDELKTIVKTLGAKLKDAYQEVADGKNTLLRLEQSQLTLTRSIEQLQASLTEKDDLLSAMTSDERTAKRTIEQLQASLTEKDDLLSAMTSDERTAKRTIEQLQASLTEKDDLLSAMRGDERTAKRTIEQLQASLSAKDHDLGSALNSEQSAKIAIEQMERDLVELRTRQATPPPSPELPLLREELLAIRSEQISWQEERRRLETALDQERQKGRAESSNTNSQLVRLAMNVKQLEDEVHSLKCERSATIRQFNQLKDFNEEAQKEQTALRQKLQEREDSLAASTRTIQELIDTVEQHKKTIASLTEEHETAIQKETQLLSQIATTNATLAQEKATSEALSTSLQAANESFRFLSAQLEQERKVFYEAEEKAALCLREKEASDTRVKEVEELLIVKLQTISDLEEQLGEALSRCDDTEHRALTLEQTAKSLAEDLQKASDARDALHEKTVQLDQQLGRATAENSELKKRTEAFERTKKSIADATAHAHALLRTLDGGTKPPLSIATLIDELSINPHQEQPLFEERFEQHELF